MLRRTGVLALLVTSTMTLPCGAQTTQPSQATQPSGAAAPASTTQPAAPTNAGTQQPPAPAEVSSTEPAAPTDAAPAAQPANSALPPAPEQGAAQDVRAAPSAESNAAPATPEVPSAVAAPTTSTSDTAAENSFSEEERADDTQRARKVRRHDGFYFRWAGGLAYLSDSIDSSWAGDAQLRGFGVGGELLFGGTPAKGLVLGGGSHAVSVASPSLTIQGADADAPETAVLSLLGGFVDYYFDESRGWHAQVFLGFAGLSADNSKPSETPYGFGLGAGVGHEWWTSAQWSVGVLARVTVASLTFEDTIYSESYGERVSLEETHTVVAPGLLASITYH